MSSRLEEILALQILAAGLPEPEREFRFSPRRYRLDFAWPGTAAICGACLVPGDLAVEVEGGLWQSYSQGGQGTGHSHPAGIERDIEKGNEALLAGFSVVRVTGKMIESGEALRLIQRVLGREVEG